MQSSQVTAAQETKMLNLHLCQVIHQKLNIQINVWMKSVEKIIEFHVSDYLVEFCFMIYMVSLNLLNLNFLQT